MSWSNISVIFRRELIDQLRDRRTLFMIFVFPMLLYPLLGYGVLQVGAAMEQKPRLVVIVGAENLPESPPLLNATRDGFNPYLFDSPAEASRLRASCEPARGPWATIEHREAAIRSGLAEAVMLIPADLPRQFREKNDAHIPIQYRSVDEPSQITYLRLREVLDRWKRGIVDERRKQDKLPLGYVQPITVQPVDVATDQEVGGSVWSRIFPFLLVLMSLTGAFYPAVDLCAGEKERGTMETLLISPASRAEIVMGKFLTVMLASVMTAILNLASMALTGFQLAQRALPMRTGAGAAASAAVRPILASPGLHSTFWMIALLIPLAAFFSAVCVALAVLAKSMKEGQYYMTPLYLVSIPLIFLTLVPEIQLNLFYSLVPITGVSLLLRSLIMGDYSTAGRYFIPVLLPTVVYAWIALRWAIDQFQREEVLFRESERIAVGPWLKHLFRDRAPTPSAGEATLGFALILSLSWFFLQYLAMTGRETSLSSVAAGQFVIMLPPLIMSVLLSSLPRRTLRLYWPAPRYLALGVGLALTLNPLVNELKRLVEVLFPISTPLKEALENLMGESPGLGAALFTFALLPAVCEEIAFRGFILSGLQHRYSSNTAIVLSSLMFGFLHVLLSIFQQLFNATLLGLVLGLMAVRSGSLLPGIVFHLVNNGLAIVQGSWVKALQRGGIAEWIYRKPDEGLYHGFWIAAGAVASALLIHALYTQGRPLPVSEDRHAGPTVADRDGELDWTIPAPTEGQDG